MFKRKNEVQLYTPYNENVLTLYKDLLNSLKIGNYRDMNIKYYLLECLFDNLHPKKRSILGLLGKIFKFSKGEEAPNIYLPVSDKEKCIADEIERIKFEIENTVWPYVH